MGVYKYIGDLWRKPKETMGEMWRHRLVEWRQDPTTFKIEYPTRLDRAHAVGYRAKPGIFIVRQRVTAGSHKRPHTEGGRRSKNQTRSMSLRKNYQLIAEERANKKFINCEVLNSYFVGHDSKHYWYEVILVDRAHPQVLADPRLNWIANQRGRVYRGLTSAGRKVRGLRHKGKGVEKARPSRRAHSRRQ